MRVTRRQLIHIINENLSGKHIIKEEIKVRGPTAFSFELCDLGDIQFSEGYKLIQDYIKENKGKKSYSDLSNLQRTMNDEYGGLDPSNPPPAVQALFDAHAAGTSPSRDPNLDPYPNPSEIADAKEAARVNLEVLQQQGADETETWIRRNMPQRLAGVFKQTFKENMFFLLNVSAYTSMGPAAALYCETLKNVVEVINKAIGAYTDTAPDEEFAAELGFTEFYNTLGREINISRVDTFASKVLSNYYSRNQISDEMQPIFDMLFLPHILSMIYFDYGEYEIGYTSGRLASLTTMDPKKAKDIEAATERLEEVIQYGADMKSVGMLADGPSIIENFKTLVDGKFVNREKTIRVLKMQISNCKYSLRASYLTGGAKKDPPDLDAVENYLAKTFLKDVKRKADKDQDPARARQEKSDFEALQKELKRLLNRLKDRIK